MTQIPKLDENGYFKMPDGTEMRITINDKGNVTLSGDHMLWMRSNGDNGIEVKQIVEQKGKKYRPFTFKVDWRYFFFIIFFPHYKGTNNFPHFQITRVNFVLKDQGKFNTELT